MVYIPNAGDQNNSNNSKGELICPIKYLKPQNETAVNSVRVKSELHWMYEQYLINLEL